MNMVSVNTARRISTSTLLSMIDWEDVSSALYGEEEEGKKQLVWSRLNQRELEALTLIQDGSPESMAELQADYADFRGPNGFTEFQVVSRCNARHMAATVLLDGIVPDVYKDIWNWEEYEGRWYTTLRLSHEGEEVMPEPTARNEYFYYHMVEDVDAFRCFYPHFWQECQKLGIVIKGKVTYLDENCSSFHICLEV